MKHLTVHAVTQEKRKYLPIKILILFLCNFVAFVTIVTIRATRNDLLLSKFTSRRSCPVLSDIL